MNQTVEIATRRQQHVTRKDFCAVFQRDMNALLALAMVLTADHETAGKVFLAAFEDCVHGAEVFRGWEESWSRRAIVKQAIRMVKPRPGDSENAPQADAREVPARLLQLAPFDRFVFAMTVLERFAVREAAVLLSCVPSDVEKARSRALLSLGSVEWPFASGLPQPSSPAMNLGATA